MTTKVRSRVYRVRSLKIAKNVNKVEISHNGAYQCVYEHLKTLILSISNHLWPNQSQKIVSLFGKENRVVLSEQNRVSERGRKNRV